MSQSGFTPISIYYSTTASAVPTAANLVPGELAINTNDGKLYYEDSSGVVQVLATKSTGSIGGSTTQVQYNLSGSLAGSANLTFDGTNLTTGGSETAARFIPTGSTVATNGMYLPSANTLSFSTNSTERMRIDSSGNVGINTTTISSGSGADRFLVIAGSASAAVPALILAPNLGNKHEIVSYNGFFRIYNSSTIQMALDNSGIVTMSAYGAGAATFSASGVISSVSDETWKVKDGTPVNTDAMLQKLEPGYWFYNEEKAPTFGKDRQLGFYAQNVHEAIGEEAAPIPEEGKPWGYYDRSVLAIAVMSLKNALNIIEELKQRIETLENK